VRFAVAAELELFAGSVRGLLEDWEPEREAVLGQWADDRDDVLGARLAELGWAELWTDPELLGPAVAGAVELGRVVAPLHLIDEATLGAPLAVGARVRHGEGRSRAAWRTGGGLALRSFGARRREPTLDASGTVVVGDCGAPVEVVAGAGRWDAWSAATAGYLAGLADGALGGAIEHARSREQFGAPLSALPAIQAKLADAALARDGLVLVAWSLASAESDAGDALAWAGTACREVTTIVQQAYGAVGFALESGVHRYYRRAKTVQVWADALRAEPG